MEKPKGMDRIFSGKEEKAFEWSNGLILEELNACMRTLDNYSYVGGFTCTLSLILN